MTQTMDISIKPWVNGATLLNHSILATVKYDGLKINIAKQDGKVYVGYKGSLIYDGEYEYPSNVDFGKILKLNLDNLKNGDALFCEYLTNKPTLMSSYTSKTLVVLGYAKITKLESKFGRLNLATTDIDYNNKVVEHYANLIGAEYPEVLINGKIYPFEKLVSSCNKRLEKEVTKEPFPEDKEGYYNKFVNTILSLESKYGGKDEGIVITVGDKFFKIQQTYQLDADSRRQKKREYGLSDELVTQAKNIGKTFQTKSNDERTIVREIAEFLNNVDVSGVPEDKAKQFLDEIQKTARSITFNNIKGNRNGLIIGKFRILTKAHESLINRAKRENDKVVIAMVVNRDVTNEDRELRRKVLNRIGGVEIIEVSTGNIGTILKKIPFTIGRVYAGTDRVAEYERMARFYNIEVVQQSRNLAKGISATKIEQNISDKQYFDANISSYGKPFYSEYKKIYLKLN